MRPDVRPIFYDPAGRRGKVAKMSLGAGAALLLMVVIAFVSGLINAPGLPQLGTSSAQLAFEAPGDQVRTSSFLYRGLSQQLLPAQAVHALRFAAFANTGVAYEALQRKAHDIDAILPEWVEVTLDGEAKSANGHQQATSLEPKVASWLRSSAPRIAVYPQLRTPRQLDLTRLAGHLADASWQMRLLDSITAYLRNGGYDGISIAFPELPASARADFVRLLRDLSSRMHQQGKRVLLVLAPDTEIAAAQQMEGYADYVVAGTHSASYSLHPQPLATQAWFESRVAEFSRHINPSKLIFAIGSYGVQWPVGDHRRTISVQDAWALAERYHAEFRFDEISLSSGAKLKDSDGIEKTIWLLDAASAFNHMRTALSVRPAGVALWQLGYEDPGVWEFLGRGRLPDNAALKGLQNIEPGLTSGVEKSNVLVQALPLLRSGKRSLVYSESAGLILQESTLRVPLRSELRTWNEIGKKTVALTFDDGPDPVYTPRILDVLAAKGVKGTFYVLGKQGAAHPDLLRRIYAEGHDVGHHSYSHGSMTEMADREIALELNSTQRVFETQLGIHTLLLRPPYLQADALLSSSNAVGGWDLLESCSKRGYVFGSIQVDPRDWMPFNNIQKIISATLDGVFANEGGVVLLHDAGGDRSKTVEALAPIIDALRAQGYTFVTTHEMVGKARDELMPPYHSLGIIASVVQQLRSAAILTPSWIASHLPGFALLATALGVARLLLIMLGAWRHAVRDRVRHQSLSASEGRLSVAVLVPAYNEEKVICRTVAALLTSEGPPFEIVVIDDGSKDATAEVVQATFAGNDRVRVFKKANGGKSSALNFGLLQIKSEVVVAIDADTVLAPDAISLLVRHFIDPTIGAVAGSAVVGNLVSMMARFQALEYVSSQNLDRRAFELVNAIGVVPGAIGAWRRSAVLEVGGYSEETLAEDADLTVAVQSKGWRIVYEPRAEAYTEAPETIEAFIKQRYRWMFGTLQVAWKTLWTGNGEKSPATYLLLTNVLVFQFGFTLIAPFMDLMLLGSIARAAWEVLSPSGIAQPFADLGILARYWLLFQLFDIATASYSVYLSGQKQSFWLVPLLILQRFSYRQILYFVAIRTIGAAIKGHIVGWGKLARTGRVTLGLAQAVVLPASSSQPLTRR